MKKESGLLTIVSMCLVSSFAVAGDYKPALELNAKQMDTVTAGFADFNAESDAFAFAEGLLSATNAQTVAFIGDDGDEGTFIVSVGGAQAAGGNTGAGAAADTDSTGWPSFTYSFNMGHQGGSLSHAGAFEITFVPSFTD